jgi:enamine deaminase RidA (YjgF/YER057c/UK114 family)
MADYAVMNRIYAGYFAGGFPTRVTVAVRELALKARIEVSGIALLG